MVQCNIDSRGKRARLIYGLIMLLVGAGLVVLRWLDVLDSDVWWVVGGLFALFGLFGVYEARAGWCAMRAMGFKTPM